MEFEQAKNRVEELVPLLKYYTQKYFDDEQVVSDYEYDMLMRELKQIEAQYPELIREDSPTQKVGASIKKGFEKVTHEVPLQSLQDVFTFEEVKEFDERMRKIAEENNTELEYVVETKIDGLSAALKYEKGILVQGATRGNGIVGEDVTANLKTVKSIPKKLKEPIDIIVRGEVFIGKEEFEKLNENTLFGMHTHFLKNSLPFKEYESPNFFINSSLSLSNNISSYNFDSNLVIVKSSLYLSGYFIFSLSNIFKVCAADSIATFFQFTLFLFFTKNSLTVSTLSKS